MKRSEVNANLRWAVELLDRYQFKLPRFDYWSLADWTENRTPPEWQGRWCGS